MSNPVIIDYYSDVLCVWAWVAQPRIEKLAQHCLDQINIRHHYIDLFGDTQTKMAKQWGDRNGYLGYAAHVQSVAQEQQIIVHQDAWSKVRPTTSANAHMVIKAVALAYGQQTSIEMALAIRQAFFVHGQDVSELPVLLSIVQTLALDKQLVQQQINNGQALAQLMTDYQQAKQKALQGSPSYLIDEGRQILYGNIGFQTLLANVDLHTTDPCCEI